MVLGAGLIAIGAQISIPMVPVPTTLQTFVLVLLALLFGSRRAAGAAAVFLLLVLCDLPVLSSAQRYGGLEFLNLRTAGYVLGFIPAAAVAGWLGHSKPPLKAFAAGLVAHVIVLACGVPVLAYWMGWPDAVRLGLIPFLAGAVVKSGAALLCAILVLRWFPRAFKTD